MKNQSIITDINLISSNPLAATEEVVPEIDAPFYNCSVPLGGWDVLYAIGFEDVNEAIKHVANTPTSFKIETEIEDDDDPDMKHKHSMSGTYESWSMVGNYSGEHMGVLVSIKDFVYSSQNIYPDGNSSKPNIEVYKHNVGIMMHMKLAWEKGEIDGKWQLTTSKDDKHIEFEKGYITHEEDKFPVKNINDHANARILLEDQITKDVIDEFVHVFAEIDYTRNAEEIVPWLKLATHKYSLTAGTDTPDKTSSYENRMNPVLYNEEATLLIVGMTEATACGKDENGKFLSLNLPSGLKKIIPKGCKAAFAYNENLIITHLIMGHLSEFYKCDINRDFEFSDLRTKSIISNKNEIELKNKLEVDYHNAAWNTNPSVVAKIPIGGLNISVSQGLIHYILQYEFVIEKKWTQIGFGLPYDMKVSQMIKTDYLYHVNPEGYAELMLVVPTDPKKTNPQFTGNVEPNIEVNNVSLFSWETLGQLGVAMLTNLIIMGATMGMMKLGSLAWEATKGVGSGTARFGKWVKGKWSANVAGEAEARVTDMAVSETIISEKSIMSIVSESDTFQASKQEGFLTETSESKIIEQKTTGKTPASGAAKSLIWEIVKFTFWQTIISKLENVYGEVKLNELKHKGAKEQYLKTLSNVIGKIEWANQKANRNFVVKKGGLTNGSFIVGLDLDFHHDDKE